MKKSARLFLITLGIVIAGLLAVSCNSAVKDELGTVVLDFGEGGGGTRALDSNGLPILNNSRILIKGEGSLSGSFSKEFSSAEGVSLSFPVGDEVKLRVSVLTPSARWSSAPVSFAVEPGVNALSLKLGKKISGLNNLLFTQTKSATVVPVYNLTFYMDGKSIPVPQSYSSEYVVARDSKGRLYVGYKSPSDETDRYTSEGDGPESITLSAVIPVTIMNDFTKGITYVVDLNGNVYKIEENAVNSGSGLTTLSHFKGPAAIDNNRVVWVGQDGPNPTKIYVKNIDGTGSANVELQSHINIGGCEASKVTDIFIRAGYAYVLFKTVNETVGANDNKLYSLGGVVRYNVNNLAEAPVKIGFSDNPAFENQLLKNYDYSKNFYNPAKVIGFDEENIYIADDGFAAVDTPAGVRIGKNRNRIGVLNIETNELTFTDAGPAKWYNEWEEWRTPNTKTIVWKNNGAYYQLDRGDEPLASAQAFATNYRDVFCYDLDGNLYILKNNKISMYPQVEGVYSASRVYTTNNPVSNLNSESGMAVDSSALDGYKYLYYIGANRIKRLKWQGNGFSAASGDTASPWGNGIALASGAVPSAMAANKDGLFVAVKESNKLMVKKYHRDGSPVYTSEINTYSNSSDLSPVVEFIHSMQILNGRLYAVSYKTEGAGKSFDFMGDTTKAVVSGRLLDLGPTFSDSAAEPQTLWSGTEEEKGYAPYRFIAVKPKELVIASDGFYGTDITHGTQSGNQRNKVLTFSLSGTLLSEISTEVAFSRQLSHDGEYCGFIWY